MKQFVIISLSLLLGLTSLQAQEEKEIVAGTRVSIYPPTGFTKGQNFTGYQKGETAIINVMDLDGGNFYSNAARFTKENFEAKGITVLGFEALIIDGYPAKYVKMQGDPNTISINMVFGDSSFSVMLMGVYPSDKEDIGEEIKQSILSASYTKDLKVDPFATAFFSLDDSDSQLKFSQANTNLFVYTINGETENNDGKPIMLVLPLPNDNSSTPKQTSESMITELQGRGLSNVEYISSGNTTINGYQAYELLVKGTINEISTNILVQTIISGDNQIVIQGLQNGGTFDPEIIRELSKTLKMK